MTDRLAVADAVERERRARRAEGLDERRGAFEVADDVARAVDLVEAGRRNRADRRHAVGRLDVVDRDQPAIEAGAPEGGGDADQEAGDGAQHGVARGLRLEGGVGQARRVAHDEVAVGDRAVGLRQRELVAQIADRRRRVARGLRFEAVDLRVDRVDACVDRAALQAQAELLEDIRDHRGALLRVAGASQRWPRCASGSSSVGSAPDTLARSSSCVTPSLAAAGPITGAACTSPTAVCRSRVAVSEVDGGRAAGRQVDQRLCGAVARRASRATPRTRRRRRPRRGRRSAPTTRAAS